MATSKPKKEALWIAQFLTTLRCRLPSQPIGLVANNREVILLTANAEFQRYTEHIEVQQH